MKSIYDVRRDNLRQLIAERFDGSQTKFAKEVGLKQPSFVSRLLTEREPPRKNIGNRLARRVEATLDLSPNWLDTPSPEPDVARYVRGPDFYRVLLSGREPNSGSLGEEAPPLTPEMGRDDRLVPLLSPDELGQLDSIASVYEARPVSAKVSVHSRPVPHAVGMRLDDDAMGERFPAGSQVVFADTRPPQANDFVVAVLPELAKACMRQWVEAAGRHFLVPLNRAYQATEVTPDCRVLGVVIEAVVFFSV